jgi:hypothetical protein
VVSVDPLNGIFLLPDQRLLAAAREDNEDMILEIFEQGKFDINFQDGSVWSIWLLPLPQ